MHSVIRPKKTLFFFLFFGIMIFGCQESENANLSPEDVLGLQSFDVELEKETLLIYGKVLTAAKETGIEIVQSDLKQESFTKIQSQLPKESIKETDEPVVALVIYQNSKDVEVGFNLGSMLAYSEYKLKDGQLYHGFYMKNNENKFEYISDLSGFTNGIFANHLFTLASKIVKPGLEYFVPGYHFVLNTSIPLLENDQMPDQLTENFKAYMVKKGITDPVVRGPNGGDPDLPECVWPCFYRMLGYCKLGPGDWICIPAPPPAGDPNCPEEDVQDRVGVSDSTRIINRLTHYAFRDDFLANSTFGQNYISYYDVFDEGTEDLLTLEIAIHAVDLFEDINPSIMEVLDPDAFESDYILITPTMNDKAKVILNLYRDLVTDPELLNIFDQVELDIDQYTGLPASAVLNDCCSS